MHESFFKWADYHDKQVIEWSEKLANEPEGTEEHKRLSEIVEDHKDSAIKERKYGWVLYYLNEILKEDPAYERVCVISYDYEIRASVSNYIAGHECQLNILKSMVIDDKTREIYEAAYQKLERIKEYHQKIKENEHKIEYNRVIDSTDEEETEDSSEIDEVSVSPINYWPKNGNENENENDSDSDSE